MITDFFWYREIKGNAAKFFRPVLLSILCQSEIIYSESRNIWETLIESNDEELILEIISLRRITSPASCIIFNSFIIARLKKFNNIESLLLLLSSTKYLAEFSLNISLNIELLKDNVGIFQENPNSSHTALFLLSEILQNTSIVHISNLVQLIETLIVKLNFGHPIILHMILDGLIQVLAFPSFLNKNVELIEKLMNYILCGHYKDKQKTTFETSKLCVPFIDVDKNLSNAVEMCKFIESEESYKFSAFKFDYERFFWIRNQLVLRGFLHAFQTEQNLNYEQWKIILTNLIDVTKSNDELKNSLAMSLLFRLSESSDPRIKISILQNITQLGATTEILSTIKALSSSMMRSMTIDLYLRLWKIEPRLYPFLHKFLVEKSMHDAQDLHLNIVRAEAIKDICDLMPHHGSDLVSLISEILNQSLESKNSEIAAALAIDATTLLCQNHIISLTSTWKALSLTSKYEKRPRVVQSLCKFFSIVPQFKRSNLEYENFNKDILHRLFHMIQWSDDFNTIICALDALKSWKYDELTLDLIPEIYRENIPLPEALPGMEVSILDLEVPGECFVQLLMKVHPTALHAAGELLSSFVKQEIAEYRSGNYIVKEGQAEPANYKNLHKQSIVKALTHFIIQQATTKKADKIADEIIIIEVLQILSQKYAKPLPPINWSFLHEFIHRGAKIKTKCIGLAAKQAIISGTAKRLIDNYLINIEYCHIEDIEIALELFADLCNGASNDILKHFYERISTCNDDYANKKVVNLLRAEKDVTNRENIAMIVSTFINRNLSDSVSMEVIRLVPPNILNMINLPSAKKIRYRCEILKLKSGDVENSVVWINELVYDQILQNECREILISSICELLLTTTSFPKKKWLNEFIILTQNKMVEKDFNDVQFLLDIFMVSIICLSGCLVTRSLSIDALTNRYQLFAQSVELISNQESYADIIGSLFEFLLYVLNHQKTSTDMKLAIKNCIKLSKNHIHYKKSACWKKVLQAIVIS